jgi:hypothetical protein
MSTAIIYLISTATIIFVPYYIGRVVDKMLNLWLCNKLERYILGAMVCALILTLFIIIIGLSDLLIKLILN